ncbi:MAG: serine protease [Methanoregula sp.]|nr:serine protease [Methanoregula sp.]
MVNVEFGNYTENTENRKSGTAIFVFYKGRFFLITARHLLIDTTIGSDKPEYAQLYTILFRVPLLDELKDKQKLKIINKSIFYDENGVLNSEYIPDGSPAKRKGEDIAAPNSIELSESTDPKDCAVTTSKDIDLAVISLRIRLAEFISKIFPIPDLIFAEELVKLGYQPITVDEMGEEPSYEGTDIFTVGYPAYVSQIERRDEIINKYEKDFSTDITLPCFTFGKVSLLSQHISYFWGDLRVYSGNSGCPVIENEKLVGIVTHDAVIEETVGVNHVPFAKATKAKFIRNLLDEQMIKDDAFVDPNNLHTCYPEYFKSPDALQKELELAIRNKPKNARITGKLEMKDYLTFEKISDVMYPKKRKFVDENIVH